MCKCLHLKNEGTGDDKWEDRQRKREGSAAIAMLLAHLHAWRDRDRQRGGGGNDGTQAQTTYASDDGDHFAIVRTRRQEDKSRMDKGMGRSQRGRRSDGVRLQKLGRAGTTTG